MWRVEAVVECKNGGDPLIIRRCYLRETEQQAKDCGDKFVFDMAESKYSILDSKVEVEKVKIYN